MTDRSTRAMGLHALAHDIATGQRAITGVRWYNPPAESHLSAVPVLPDALHSAVCPSYAGLLQDDEQHVIVCAECKLAVEYQDAA